MQSQVLTVGLPSLRRRELLQEFVERVIFDASVLVGVLQNRIKMIVEPQQRVVGASLLVVLQEVGLLLRIRPVIRLSIG